MTSFYFMTGVVWERAYRAVPYGWGLYWPSDNAAQERATDHRVVKTDLTPTTTQYKEQVREWLRMSI